jgi:hypothetical protein
MKTKKVLVISDNKSVAEIIGLIETADLKIAQLRLNSAHPIENPIPPEEPDLLVLALSSYANEPIVALAQTSLTGFIGRIPILVISAKPFKSDRANRITHMDFPFTVDQLNARVRNILPGETQDTEEQNPPPALDDTQAGQAQ